MITKITIEPVRTRRFREEMTREQIMRMIPKAKKDAVYDAWEDSDGIWIMLKEGWNADGMDDECRTIHCGGDDEPLARTKQDLREQIRMIRKL